MDTPALSTGVTFEQYRATDTLVATRLTLRDFSKRFVCSASHMQPFLSFYSSYSSAPTILAVLLAFKRRRSHRLSQKDPRQTMLRKYTISHSPCPCRRCWSSANHRHRRIVVCLAMQRAVTRWQNEVAAGERAWALQRQPMATMPTLPTTTTTSTITHRVDR